MEGKKGKGGSIRSLRMEERRAMVKGERSGGMLVAGVMSGTSADGVDVAVCRIAEGADGEPKIRVLGHEGFGYPRAIREAVLRAMDAKAMSVAEMSRLSWRLGEVYGDCVVKACAELGVEVPGRGAGSEGLGREAGSSAAPQNDKRIGRSPWSERAVALLREAHLNRDETAAKMGHPVLGRKKRLELVGMHGQTVYHQGLAARYLGRDVRCTWQIGEAAVVAERLRVPVVSDFRPADLAAGGQGAPLVPMLDFCVFRSERVGRVLQNLGGIGNLTALAAGASADKVIAFDTGPGNMVIDACMRSLFGREFDRGGAVARRGAVLREMVEREMRARYFSAPPPKSCGREEFGERFTTRFVRACKEAGGSDADVVATATALTAESVVRSYREFVMEGMGSGKVEFAVAGGGAKNGTLMGMVREGMSASGVKVRGMEELGVAVEAKEAVAFALLAWLTWQGRVGNVPAATGAGRGGVLGKVCYG